MPLFSPVEGLPATPPAHSLVGSAARPDPAAMPRWETGLSWVPERCGVGYQLLPQCSEAPPGFVPDRLSGAHYLPNAARFAYECSTLGGDPDLERLRRIAEAQTPFVVAREAWTGELTLSDPYTVTPGGPTQSNAYLASPDATVVGASATSPLSALGRLEQAAQAATRGQNVYLHVPLAVLPHLNGYLRPVGNTLVTLAGNTVVADAGYTGSGPDGETPGATVWAYATPPVRVLLSPIQVDDVTDHQINTRSVWASRLFAATWDPCAHHATEVTLPT